MKNKLVITTTFHKRNHDFFVLIAVEQQLLRHNHSYARTCAPCSGGFMTSQHTTTTLRALLLLLSHYVFFTFPQLMERHRRVIRFWRGAIFIYGASAAETSNTETTAAAEKTAPIRYGILQQLKLKPQRNSAILNKLTMYTNYYR